MTSLEGGVNVVERSQGKATDTKVEVTINEILEQIFLDTKKPSTLSK